MITSNNKLSVESTVTQNVGNIVSNMDGEKVILRVDNGKYYNLGQMGSSIWDMLEKPIQVEEMIDHLMDEYIVERAVCKEQVISFLEELLREELIKS